MRLDCEIVQWTVGGYVVTAILRALVTVPVVEGEGRSLGLVLWWHWMGWCDGALVVLGQLGSRSW